MTPTDDSSILAVVPARGGSKGIPRKNIRLIAGRPLIDWTIAAALACPRIGSVVVSTDDSEIASVARACGAKVPFLRPAELARDETPGVAPVLHAIEQLPGYSHVMLLQPTSPLRTVHDIDAAIDLATARQADSVVSVTQPDAHPMWTFQLDETGRLRRLLDAPPAVRRQDLPPVYALNGAIYLVRTDWLRRTGALVTPDTLALPMPRERSVDIDTPIDWALAEALLKDIS